MAVLRAHSDVHVFAGLSSQPSVTISRLELMVTSPMLSRLMSSLTFCDGCRDPVTFIIAEEEESVVTAAFTNKKAKKATRRSVVSGPGI